MIEIDSVNKLFKLLSFQKGQLHVWAIESTNWCHTLVHKAFQRFAALKLVVELIATCCYQMPASSEIEAQFQICLYMLPLCFHMGVGCTTTLSMHFV